MDSTSTGDEGSFAIEGRKIIDEICKVAWTRLPGSKGERDAQTFIREKMTLLGAESTDIHVFKTSAAFFRWWPVVSILLFYASLLFYNIVPVLAALVSVVAILNVVSKLFSVEFLDILFGDKASSNVVGTLKQRASGPPKRVIIIGGHADSNYEFPIGSRFGTKLVPLLIPVFVSMAACVIVTTIKSFTDWAEGGIYGGYASIEWRAFVAPNWLDVIYFAIVAMVPYNSWIGFRMISSNAVPGANDNLSGIAVVLLLLKHFADPKRRPENVELRLVSFGSEEGGMKGSKHMAKLIRDALDADMLGAPSAWVVNFDSIGTSGLMVVATKEPMYRCTYLPDVYTQMAASAETVGVKVVVKSLAAGTDSAPFGRLRIPATGIVGMGEGNSPANWHSMSDTPENVDAAGIENCVKMGIQFIEDVDRSLGGGK